MLYAVPVEATIAQANSTLDDNEHVEPSKISVVERVYDLPERVIPQAILDQPTATLSGDASYDAPPHETPGEDELLICSVQPTGSSATRSARPPTPGTSPTGSCA